MKDLEVPWKTFGRLLEDLKDSKRITSHCTWEKDDGGKQGETTRNLPSLGSEHQPPITEVVKKNLLVSLRQCFQVIVGTEMIVSSDG